MRKKTDISKIGNDQESDLEKKTLPKAQLTRGLVHITSS